MAHFAEIDENNIVINVVRVPDEQEHRGQEWLAVDSNLGGTWIQTSYNTFEGQHSMGKAPLRKNYAKIGDIYDPTNDAFHSPKPVNIDGSTEDHLVLNPDTFKWELPVPNPNFADDISPMTHNIWFDIPTLTWHAELKNS